MSSLEDAESEVKLFSASSSSPAPAEPVTYESDPSRDDKSLPSLLNTDYADTTDERCERPRRGCSSTVRSSEILTVSTTQKIPKKISEFIVDFYLENALVLLRNTSSRHITVNSERDQLYETLTRRIEAEFGLAFDRKKIKTHFEHFKYRTLAKGAKMMAGMNRQSKTAQEGAPEELRAVNPRAFAFDMSEFKLWSYLNDSPVTVGEQLADCSVVLQPCTSISAPGPESSGQAEVGGVTGNQESEVFDDMAASPTSSGSTDSAVDISRVHVNGCDGVRDRSSAHNRRKRKYEELLDEQILMYREQRRLFTEMANAQMQMSAMVGSLHDVVKAVMHRLVGNDAEPSRVKGGVAASPVVIAHDATERSREVRNTARLSDVKQEDLGTPSDIRSTNKIYRAKRVEHKGYHVARDSAS
ncbi:hypothetical protein Y032_0020g190 [Ancylostoma ceylanicum]|uniref:Uncharacterized protein n=1 Tax=Ancylostoma ceylanicum TaxID=53326 RepID=A0A016V2V1_9BILA|nr:hypothetical protein Y032_0020g190 [Ancylostoma ceylanicum]